MTNSQVPVVSRDDVAGQARQIARSARRTLLLLARRGLPTVTRRYEVGKFAERRVRPTSSTDSAAHPFAEGALLPCPGLTFDLDAQTALVTDLVRHREIFESLHADPSINLEIDARPPRIRNRYYGTPDAEIYAAMVGHTTPSVVVEVGGGYSTLIARRAIERFSPTTELVVIDPEPRTDVRQAADRLLLEQVERVPRELIELPPDAILFIDSSHVLRIGGDVEYLYGTVLPTLAPGVRVHIHDVYLPFDYPSFAAEHWWTEQPVLQALLSHSPRYRVELATRWLTRTAPDVMADAFGEVVRTEPGHAGGSLWFQVTDGALREPARDSPTS